VTCHVDLGSPFSGVKSHQTSALSLSTIFQDHHLQLRRKLEADTNATHLALCYPGPTLLYATHLGSALPTLLRATHLIPCCPPSSLRNPWHCDCTSDPACRLKSLAISSLLIAVCSDHNTIVSIPGDLQKLRERLHGPR
jgi:hypothetical protein